MNKLTQLLYHSNLLFGTFKDKVEIKTIVMIIFLLFDHQYQLRYIQCNSRSVQSNRISVK